ncbi:hypothetical protein, partial [uncultured Tateyamaria sp.]|uniref:hypothetical protein n=1 Tax=uncultured Tateyamaria sp. TaxID=455651 RepID=UPI002616F236
DLRRNTDGLAEIARHTSPELRNWLATESGPETLSVTVPEDTGGLPSGQTLALSKAEVAEIMTAAYVDFKPAEKERSSNQSRRRKGEVIAALRRMPSSVVNDLFKGNPRFKGAKTGWNNRRAVMTQVLNELRQPKEFRAPALADLRRNTDGLAEIARHTSPELR